MYSDGLADGIWDEAPDVYVPGSILANWELRIVAGLQMEYGVRPRMHMCQDQYLRTGSFV